VNARLEAAPRTRTAWPSWMAWPRLASAAALAALILIAFWVGRGQGRSDMALTAEQRERILLLDELERVLVDVANSPETVSGPEFNTLWRRIQANGLLIKMRIAESQSRQDVRGLSSAPASQI